MDLKIWVLLVSSNSRLVCIKDCECLVLRVGVIYSINRLRTRFVLFFVCFIRSTFRTLSSFLSFVFFLNLVLFITGVFVRSFVCFWVFDFFGVVVG